MTRVVVTGMGAITPAGTDVDALWEAARAGRSTVRTIDRFDASAYRCRVAGQADDFDAKESLPGRLTKKTDRFTHLALAAADAAIEDAGLSIGDGGVAPERIGVMVGNVLGGWEFAERELRDLWTGGPRAVSPYQATAWFPAAAQGNICIQYGIKGRARTFVCDRASGAYAIIHAAETIQRGLADVVLAGGSEAPLSPYAWLCCQTGAFLSPLGNAEPERAYRPFDRRHGGTILGEGSVFLVLERADHAQARGAPIHGELTGWAVNNDGYMPYYTNEPLGQMLARVIKAALSRASIAVSDLGAVIADGSAIPREDSAEIFALRSAVGAGTPVSAVKPVTGHLMGAGTVADSAIALRSMREGEIAPIANLDEPAPGFDVDFVVGKPRPAKDLSTVAVVSRGVGGVNACLVWSR